MAEIGSEMDSLYDSNVHGSCGARSVDFGVRHGEDLEAYLGCNRWDLGNIREVTRSRLPDF